MKIPSRKQYSINGLMAMISYLGQYRDLSKLRLVEIGSWIGTSACIFARYFKEILCIDPFKIVRGTITENFDMETVYNRFIANISKYKNITHLKHTSFDVLPNFRKKEIDIIYIDGSHIYEDVLKDIELAKQKVRYFICGHDYWPERFPGVVDAVGEVIGKPDRIFVDTSWIKAV